LFANFAKILCELCGKKTICLNQDFQDYKISRIKKRRHCGLDPQSLAKRYIVIASREERMAQQSRNQRKPFLYTNLTIPKKLFVFIRAICGKKKFIFFFCCVKNVTI